MSPTISIISPVYNAEPFIEKCVDSIIGQTYTDWELILVDDGSPDNAGVICDKYAAKDKRIRVIHKENGGVSAARQTGLDEAEGEYVIHVDPDDWVESEMLEELLLKAKETGADVVICDYYINQGDQLTYRTQSPTSLNASQVLKDLFQQLHGSCCNKLAKRVCYNRYDIRFPKDINYCEDLLTWVQLFSHNEVKVAYLPKAFYHYCMNENSISHHLTRQNYEGLLRYLDKLEEILPDAEYRPLKDRAALGVFTESFIGRVMTESETAEMFDKVRTVAFASAKSIRWKLGYLMIDWKLYSVAHLLIRY